MQHLKLFFTSVLLGLGATTLANAETFHCQITANPGLFYRDITWDGSTPFQFPIEYNQRPGLFKVSSIGLAGHPDYLFEIKIEDRTVLAASQERHLKDYNVSWRSDDETVAQSLVNVACRLRPGS